MKRNYPYQYTGGAIIPDRFIAQPTPEKKCCKSCGKKWEDHLGIEGTCKKLEISLHALRELAIFGTSEIAQYCRAKLCKIEDIK